MKRILVKEVYKSHGTASVALPEDTPLEDVIARFAHEPVLRGIFLVDSQQRLAGVITRMSLMKWVHFQLFGGRPTKTASPWEVFRFVGAAKAKDLSSRDWKSLPVVETDSLQTALERMIEHNEGVVPVVDTEGKILGDLRLPEVLLKALEVGKQATP
jgi:CBS domain-containing protein